MWQKTSARQLKKRSAKRTCASREKSAKLAHAAAMARGHSKYCSALPPTRDNRRQQNSEGAAIMESDPANSIVHEDYDFSGVIH
jgi:hypothetical protein